jgi:hypothetical protein
MRYLILVIFLLGCNSNPHIQYVCTEAQLTEIHQKAIKYTKEIGLSYKECFNALVRVTCILEERY